jgi:hypothetical protein
LPEGKTIGREQADGPPMRGKPGGADSHRRRVAQGGDGTLKTVPFLFHGGRDDHEACIITGGEKGGERRQAVMGRFDRGAFAVHGATSNQDVRGPRVAVEREGFAGSNPARRQRLQINQFSSRFDVDHCLLEGTGVTLGDGNLRKEIETRARGDLEGLLKPGLASLRGMKARGGGARQQDARARSDGDTRDDAVSAENAGGLVDDIDQQRLAIPKRFADVDRGP